jgi:hypothetical protein
MANILNFSEAASGQANADRISVYDLAYVRRNRAHDLPKVEARRDFARQIEQQVKPLVFGDEAPFLCSWPICR